MEVAALYCITRVVAVHGCYTRELLRVAVLVDCSFVIPKECFGLSSFSFETCTYKKTAEEQTKFG